jgi:hypothetical protein
MPSLYEEHSRTALKRCLSTLKLETVPRWGKFTAPQMLAHVDDALRMYQGDLSVAPKNSPIRFPPLKQLFIYALPVPRGVPTSPELLLRIDRAQLEIERAAFPGLLERVGSRSTHTDWPMHPAFGRLSTREWGLLGFKHTDHHFSQLGI